MGSSTYRMLALRSLVFLLAFYVIAVALIVLIVVVVVASVRAGRFRPQLLGAVLTALTLAGAIVRLDRTGDPDEGSVDAGDESRLRALVADVARRMGADPPDRIRLALEANAFVYARSRLLGLLPGPTTLVIGLPMLAAISVDELRALVAHELGHLHRGDTRLGGVVYRARMSIGRAAETLVGPLGAVFKAFERAFLRSTTPIARAQEAAADQEAIRVAGPVAVAEVLLRSETVSLAYDWYVGRYVTMVWRAGRWPLDVFQGFVRMLALPERAEELADLQRRLGTQPVTPWDSHPPLTERVACALALSIGEPEPPVREPALSLLEDVGRIERELALLAGVAATGDPAAGILWERVAEDLWQPEQQEYAEAVLAVTGWLLARERGVGPSDEDPEAAPEDLLDLLDHGAEDELVRLLLPGFEDLDGVEREAAAPLVLDAAMFAVLGDALVRRRGCRWQISEIGPIELVDLEGFAIDLERLAQSACTSPEARADIRDAIAQPEPRS